MPESMPFRSVVKLILLGIGLLFILAYVIFQARFLIIGPQIVLYDTLPERQNERQVILTGVASNISRLWLNERPIYTDPKGYFEEALILENGYTVATIKAEDRYGRETRVTKSFVYTPSSFIE